MPLNPILRRLGRMPMFSAIAVLTLAIGIGANTAIFSVVQGILLKPLPYPRSDELVTIDHSAPGINLPNAGAAPFLYFTYREQGRTFQDVGLWNTGHGQRHRTRRARGNADAVRHRRACCRSSARSRGWGGCSRGPTRRRAARDGHPHVGVLAVEVRRRIVGDRADADDRRQTARSHRRAPESFRFLDRRVSLVVPYQLDRSKTFLGQFSFNAMARLKPGAPIEQASADAARLIPISFTLFPPFPGSPSRCSRRRGSRRASLSLKDDLVGDIKRVLWVLMGTIGLVLLVACANVANLLLVRAEARQQELAVRAALGAGTKGIARELLMESVVAGARRRRWSASRSPSARCGC